MPPEDTRDGRVLLRRLGGVWLTYIKGQLLMALLIGGITWIVGAAIGLPGAFWLGLVAGMLQTIPSIGPLIAMVPAVIVALIQGSTVISVQRWLFALIVAGCYLFIQQMGALIIEPHVIGKRLKLPPLLVLLGVTMGAFLGGVLGAYLAVPLLASAREIVRFIREGSRDDTPPQE